MQRNIFSYFKPPPTAVAAVDKAIESPRQVEDHPPKQSHTEIPASPDSIVVDGGVQGADNGATEAVLKRELLSTLEATNTADAASEYELRRLANIRRNAAFLQQLGLDEVKGGIRSAAPPPKRARAERQAPPPQMPTRRSTRNILPPPSYAESAAAAAASDGGGSSESEDDEGLYDDSDVFKYVLSEEPSPGAARGGASGGDAGGGLRLRGLSGGSSGALWCAELPAVYSMHVHERAPSLCLAGGKGGQVALFRLPAEGEPAAEGTALMSFKAHSKWVGSARLLVPRLDGGGPPGIFAATCADDGSVKVWDVSMCRAAQDRPGASKQPLLAAESRDIHSRGIYCMDVHGDASMLTGSKDRTVVMTSVLYSSPGTGAAGRRSVELRRLAQFDVHEGVVKSVAWQRPADEAGPPVVFASGGVDNRVVVKDTRVGGRGDLCLSGLYGRGGVHTVQWSPERDQAEHLLLVAGFEESLKLFDIRRPDTAAPLFDLRGHGCRSKAPNKALQTPAFIAGKYSVATAGQGNSYVSIYSTLTGKCVSRGEISDEPNAIFSAPCGAEGGAASPRALLLVACRRGAIHPLEVCGACEPLGASGECEIPHIENGQYM